MSRPATYTQACCRELKREKTKYHSQTNHNSLHNRSFLSLTRYPGELLCVKAASGVYPEGGSADECRPGRQEKGDGGGDLVRRAQALGRDLGPRHLEDVDRVVGSGSVGVDHSGSHAVDPNSALGELNSHCPEGKKPGDHTK